MHLKCKSLGVSGFKNINDIQFDVSRITALVGLNNFGKTNVFKGIAYGFEFIKRTKDIREQMMNPQGNASVNKSMVMKNYKFSTLFSYDDIELRYVFSFAWDTEDTKGRIIEERLEIKRNSTKFEKYISRTNKIAKYKASPKGRCDKGIIIQDNELILNKLQYFDALFYLEDVKAILEFSFIQYNNFDTSIKYESIPLEFEPPSFKGNSYVDIAKKIFKLKEEHIDRYEVLEDAFLQLFPEIEFIKIVEVDVKEQLVEQLRESNISLEFEQFGLKFTTNIYQFFVKEKYNVEPLEFIHLSDGTRRIFLLLFDILRVQPNESVIIALEELENNIHPRLFRNLLIILDQIIGDQNLIISSHSPFLIQYLNLDNIYIGITNNENIGNFRKLKKAAQKRIISEATKEGISTGESIFNMLVEDNLIESDFMRSGK